MGARHLRSLGKRQRVVNGYAEATHSGVHLHVHAHIGIGGGSGHQARERLVIADGHLTSLPERP